LTIYIKWFHFRRFSQNCEKRLLAAAFLSVFLSVCVNNSILTGEIYVKIDTGLFLKNLSRKCNFDLNVARIRSALREDLCTFVTRSRWIILRMGNVTRKILQKLKLTFYDQFFFFSECGAVYEIMRKNLVQPDSQCDTAHALCMLDN
jgi:hypothetical protein